MLSLTHPDEVRIHLAASAALSLVRLRPAAQRDPSALGDTDNLDAMRAIVSDVSLSSHPPLAAIADVLRILFHRDEVEIAPADSAGGRDYRLKVVVPWLRDDESLETLGVVARSRRGPARARFQRFAAREIGRALHDLCRFPVRIDCPRLPGPEALHLTGIDLGALAIEADALAALAAAWPENGRLLSDEQLSLLRYVRDEADVVPLREYHLIRSRLRPVSLRAVQKTRNARYRQREVRDERSPSMGGYSGLRSGGSLEDLNALLPSELAQMESGADRVGSRPALPAADHRGKGGKPSQGFPEFDLFDLNLVEKRLLYFKRDQQIDIRRKRQFHVVFWAPERFDYRGSVVPARWPYLFLGVVFDVIRFFRDELSVTNCPFYFVFHGKSAELDRYQRLIAAIREQDFRDVDISCAAIAAGQLQEHLQSLLGNDDEEHLVLCLAERGSAMDVVLPPEMALLQVEFSTSSGADSVMLADGEDRHELSITDETSLGVELNRFRNLLAVSMAGAQAPRRL